MIRTGASSAFPSPTRAGIRWRCGFPVLIGVAAMALAACSSGSGGGGAVGSLPSVLGSGGVSTSEAPTHSTSEGDSRSTAATLGIPPGHLPPPGECKIWVPGRPPGKQKGSGDCDTLGRRVPPGAWLVYRPSKSRKEVKVWVYDDASPRVTAIRIYDVISGRLLSEEAGDR